MHCHYSAFVFFKIAARIIMVSEPDPERPGDLIGLAGVGLRTEVQPDTNASSKCSEVAFVAGLVIVITLVA